MHKNAATLAIILSNFPPFTNSFTLVVCIKLLHISIKKLKVLLYIMSNIAMHCVKTIFDVTVSQVELQVAVYK